MRNLGFVFTLIMLVFLALPAQAGPDSPIASKDGITYTLNDLNIYWLRNLGKDGLLDFFQMMVIYQEGVKQGLKPTKTEVDEFIRNQMGLDIYDQFKQLYPEQTVRQLVEYTIIGNTYEEWLRDKIRRENNITVTEQEANDYFLDNLDQFHVPKSVNISLISVDNQTQANAVLDRLRQGENFNDIAGEVNLDANMRARRGELGNYQLGQGLPEPLEQAAFALSEGEYSEVIKGQNYHIVFCHRHYREVNLSFEEVKEQLMLDIVEAKIDPIYFRQVGELMDRELPAFNIEASLFRPEE